MPRLGMLLAGMFAVGCAHGPDAPQKAEAPVLVLLNNKSDHDVCAVHLWSEDDAFRSVENRLLPGAQLLEPTSAFRLHAGSRRDFTVPAATPLRVEAVDCEGRLIESRELPARPGTVVWLSIGSPPRG